MAIQADLSSVAALVAIAVIGIGGYFLSRAAADRLRVRGAPPHEVRTVRLVILLVALVLVAAALFVAFGPFPPVSGLTVSAIIALVATIALQTTISNVIAGYILIRNRLLRLNDQIQVGGITGKVVQLGFVTTWLRLEDGSLASVANSTLLSGPLLNRSAGERLRGEY